MIGNLLQQSQSFLNLPQFSFRAAKRSSPAYAPRHAHSCARRRSSHRSVPNCDARPSSKSLGSCAGVIFTAPVPNSRSTISSPTIEISRSINGSTTFFPIKVLITLILGMHRHRRCHPTLFPAASSPLSKNSVVVPATGYLICQKVPRPILVHHFQVAQHR